MTDSRSVPARVGRWWMASAMAFTAALTITLAALRGADHDVVVTVDDGIEMVAENLPATYRVRVRNNTDQQLDRLEVTLTMPPSLVPAGADSGPAQGFSGTKWLVDVAAGTTVQVEVGVVTGTVSEGTEITVIACASAVGMSVSCGTDVNRGTIAMKAEGGADWLTMLMMWWQLLLAAPVLLLVVFAACRPRKRGGEGRGQASREWFPSPQRRNHSRRL